MKRYFAVIMTFIETLINWITQPLFIISAIFWLTAFLLAKFLGKKKDRITIAFPFLVLFRSKIFNRMFQKIGSKNRKFWRIWFNIGAILSFILMLGALYFFISNFFQLIFDPKPENAILPLIPGVTISLPMFSFLLLPILINLTVHEFSHAIAAEIDDVKVKSSGLMGAGIFAIIGFGAFVEVDDFQMYNREINWKTRLRTYSGGIWSNIIVAGIFLLLLTLSPYLSQIGYSNTTFKVETVLSAEEGGFNDGNIEIGDIAYSINGTRLDYDQGLTLEAFLANETDFKFSIGDSMVITCIDPKTRDFYNRTISLGHRAFVGLITESVNNTMFRVNQVYTFEEGGNNFGKIPQGVVINKVNGIDLDYNEGITFEWLLTQQVPPYQMNLTSTNGTIYEINVNFQPKAAGAYLFNEIFLGILFEVVSNNKIEITEVLRNETEYGINEGNMPENTIITHINGININLESETFPEWLNDNINPNINDVLIFTSEDGTNYSMIVGDIPVIPVYIGIISSPYSLPQNFLGRLFGGNFPAQFEMFLTYTLVVAFSLALFNLLPTAIFDGGRMMKEIIELIIGKEEKPGETKKLHYLYDPEEKDQHLMLHNISKILSLKRLDPKENPQNDGPTPRGKINPENYNETSLEFEAIDEYQNGYFERVKPLNSDDLAPKTLMQVEVEYISDLKAPLKKKIYRSISWLVGGLVLASFILSIVKFGNTFFWL